MLDTAKIKERLILSYFTEKYERKFYWYFLFSLLLICGYLAFFYKHYEMTDANILIVIFFSIGLSKVLSGIISITYIDSILKTAGGKDIYNLYNKLEKKLNSLFESNKYLEQELLGDKRALDPTKNKLRKKHKRNEKRIFLLEKELALFKI